MAARPVYEAPPVAEPGRPWQIRVRAPGVITRDSGHVTQVPGSGVAISDTAVPELDISYDFTPNIAAELILGVTRHQATGIGVAATDRPDAGRAWLLPPTLTSQYHFADFGPFQPYVGAGVNCTWFFGQSAGNVANAAGSVVTSSHLHNSASPVARIGFDDRLDRHADLNVDVKKPWLRPNWDGTLNGVTAIVGTVNLDPRLVVDGVTSRF